jgi:hypothetical protein
LSGLRRDFVSAFAYDCVVARMIPKMPVPDLSGGRRFSELIVRQ